MRLSSATRNALQKANIECLEDLFSYEEYELLNIPGIGKKRVKDMLDLLYELPFDYQDKSLPLNPEQNPYAGVHPTLQNYLSGHWSTGDKFYRRGVDYFEQRKVSTVELQDNPTQTYKAKAFGTRQYTVTLKLGVGDQLKVHCTCPAFARWSYGNAGCKHVVAAALTLAEQQRLARFAQAEDGHHSYRLLQRSLKTAQSLTERNESRPLDYLLVRKGNQWELYPRRIYPVAQPNYQYGRWKNPWDELKPAHSKDRMIVSYLRQIHAPAYAPYSSKQSNRSFGDVLGLLRDRAVFLKRGKDQSVQLHFREEPFTLEMAIDRVEDQSSSNDETGGTDLVLGFRLRSHDIVKRIPEVEVISTDPCWIIYDSRAAQVTGTEFGIKVFLGAARDEVRIPSGEIESFLRDMYPAVQEAKIPIRMADGLTAEKSVEPVPRLYLREVTNRLKIQFRAAYGDDEITSENDRETLFSPNTEHTNEDDPILWEIRRDMAAEEQWIAALQESGLEPTGAFRTFSPKMEPLKWVIDHLPSLAEEGFEIYGEQQLKRYAPPKKLTSSSLSVRSGERWFEVEGSMTFGDTTVNMNDIRRVLVRDKPYIRLQDGTTGELPADWLERLKTLLHLMQPGKKSSRVPKIAAPVVQELGEVADEYQADATFDDYAAKLREFDRVESIEAPRGFRGELRPYQEAGLSWLWFLNRYGFGGILADDMGLGKTIQVLALLQKVRESSGDAPSALVIAPRSVLHNWEAETDRFLPDWEVYIHHGTDRAAIIDDMPNAPLTATTYSTMRNDISFLQEREYDYIILDESHTIRNPASKTFRAIRQLRATHRLCLTGTPVQNTTMDLWSQFEFLNPGILGGQKQFREKWVKPLEQENDDTAEKILHKSVAPFILRRTKQQVAKDLPPLTSSQVDCPMDTIQQSVYEKYRQVYHKIVNEEIDTKGVRESRFTVLEGLTRLRQICCAPELVDGETGSSAKLSRFVAMAEELISEGHRALVFSQFVQFLKKIEAVVQSRGWDYEYLDGQTRNRQERVDRFQSDDSKNLFLISLKAGGEGLNLTGADYVFLMDPWWNPAAERQAMDRTHRIGQDEHVFAYRFVCPGTVEEKILRLQDRKRDLAEKLIVAEPGIFKRLERNDLVALFE